MDVWGCVVVLVCTVLIEKCFIIMTDISQAITSMLYINSVVACKLLMVQMLKSVGSIPYGRNNGRILTNITACDSNSSTKNVSCRMYANSLTVSQTRKKV